MDFPRICPARWLSDPNFGMMSMPPHDFLYPFYDMNSNYIRPWKWYNQAISKEFGSTIENEKGNYKISLDVQHFRPNDISVKVTENEIIVEGKHEERQDTHGFISRQFKRRYALPSHCPAENVTSTMSSDGILTIIAEKRSSNGREKIVPIKICGVQSKMARIESKMSTEIAQKSKETIKETEDTTSDKNKTQILLKEEHSRLFKPELLKATTSDRNGEMSSKQVTENIGKSQIDATNISDTSNKTDKTQDMTSLGQFEMKEKLGQSLATTSEMCAMKGMSKTVIEESSSSYKSSSSSMSSTIKTSGKIGECTNDIISAKLKEAAENV